MLFIVNERLIGYMLQSQWLSRGNSTGFEFNMKSISNLTLSRYRVIALAPCAQVDYEIKQVDNTKSLHKIPISKFCVQISRSRLVLSRYRVVPLSHCRVVALSRCAQVDNAIHDNLQYLLTRTLAIGCSDIKGRGDVNPNVGHNINKINDEKEWWWQKNIAYIFSELFLMFETTGNW